MDAHKHSFSPVVNADTRILILGSLPGDASLAQQQYYAHPQNRFWHLLSELVGVNLVEQTYQDKLACLLQHGIGLWDVIASAQRRGSLDSQIKEHQQNDLPGLIASLPRLEIIAFNGGTAAKIGTKILASMKSTHTQITLPSSSPAYTLPYAQKLEAWKELNNKKGG
ncbi:MAG: DNA-deoxyinosine glycosylase [Burkholderiales bacterium]|nr:DNA-deoxyinosine glycosylase [Burkholderiales bacterium]